MKRNFHPGEDWLYFRLYGGPESIDSWLVNILPGVISELESRGQIRKWFFLRYLDPLNHLRLRFELLNPDETGAVISLINQKSRDFINQDLIWKTEIGTYEREIERYGEEWIETAEEIFWVDSIFWLKILPQIRMDEKGEDKRWRLAMLSADNMFGSFEYAREERIQLLGKLVESLTKEMGGGKKLKLQIDEKFRKNRSNLEQLISNYSLISLSGFVDTIENRKHSINGIIDRASNSPAYSRLNEQRLTDLIHLSLNRGLRSKHRMHELVIYSFLKQLYQSAEARIGN